MKLNANLCIVLEYYFEMYPMASQIQENICNFHTLDCAVKFI